MAAMDKVIDRLNKASETHQPYYSFEFFPPVTEQGMSNLIARIERMASLDPASIAITWGAGGSTQQRSLLLADGVQSRAQVPACLHLTCTNMERARLDETLQQAKGMGIRNILALRGDPPRGEEYWVAADARFQHAADLVRYIRQNHGDYFCIGVAAYPEGHGEQENVTLEQEIEFLKAKVDAGADYIVTQLFYDVSAYIAWLKLCRESGITVPVVPGIMPIHSYQSFRRMVKLTRTNVPKSILNDLEPIQTDDQAVKQYGIDLSIKMVQELQANGINAFHFCTLNLEKSVRSILDGLAWQQHSLQNTLVSKANGIAPEKFDDSKAGRMNADQSPPQNLLKLQDNASSWDEHPNGRFGDVRSPAYGELDGWGVSLKLTPSEAITQWGYPASIDDISNIFARYLDGGITQSLPWSDMPLMAETQAIVPALRRLNLEKAWWTVGSQPAVDGAPSSDKTYGFGPKGGYVYQKAFVEFWAEESEVQAIAEKAERLERSNGGMREVTWYAAGRLESQWRTNMNGGDANAVTWGIFPGKELITTTLIEEVSFKAWREEAFSIWTEWERLYPQHSASRSLLNRLGEKRWLVSVVHHDFKRPDALWQFLLD